MPFEIAMSVIILIGCVLGAVKPLLEVTITPFDSITIGLILNAWFLWMISSAVWTLMVLLAYWLFGALASVIGFISTPQIF